MLRARVAGGCTETPVSVYGALCQLVTVHIQLSFQGQLMPQFMPLLVDLYVLIGEMEELMTFEHAESSEEICLLVPSPDTLSILF